MARLFGLAAREAVDRAVLMAQGGEFAFVLYSAAGAGGDRRAPNAIFTAVVILSMALTPLVVLRVTPAAPRPAQIIDGVE